ncbi:hypothetical protein [Streptomyces sp. NPDC097981]|uniref:hypothetical protein n=1 Tax=Streptomyces sp. NPDC097981 TaxID=3155428 RepID=UPI00332FAEB9
MPVWLIVEEETLTADDAASRRQIKVVRRLNGNRTRDEALVELGKLAKSHRPDSLKGTSYIVGRDGDGSFWFLPRSGKAHAPCTLRLMEEIRG